MFFQHVSIFLLDTCMMESKVWVMAETLDAIMDIYSEDASDQLASEIKLVEKLHTLLPLFKNKARLFSLNYIFKRIKLLPFIFIIMVIFYILSK